MPQCAALKADVSQFVYLCICFSVYNSDFSEVAKNQALVNAIIISNLIVVDFE